MLRQKKRVNPKRTKPRRKRPELFGHDHGLRLRGKAKEKQRRAIFERSKGRCEEIVRCSLPECNEGGKCWHTYLCWKPITWESMEWSHKRHAANKCDCLMCGIASCHQCHVSRHNAGGKPCPSKSRIS